ncbi:hypothetical protein MKW92_018508 [Papaver armeniacum]|nr:hypothetical protein MKW92_018508 [Papaver armeniacum]
MEAANFPIVDRIVPVATSREAKTLVLFGRVGNGKSALGNSILGKTEFLSRISASGVTTTCKLGTTRLDDGQVVNVIDTPGLFDPSRGHEYYTYEMVKSINLAKGGIDGFILVCSIKTRFSTEEEDAIKTLRDIFGEEITNYMIIVFTGGDELETTFPEYLSTCPTALQRVLRLLKNRVVLFDNKTKDETQRKEQVRELMSLVDMVKSENQQSYTGDIFEMMKREALFKEENQQRINNEAQQEQLGCQRGYEAAQTSTNNWAQRVQFDYPKGGSGSEMAQKLYQQEKAKREKMEMEVETETENETIKIETNKDSRAGKAVDVIRLMVGVMALGSAAGACTIM